MAVDNGLDAGVVQGSPINDSTFVPRRQFNTFGLPHQRFYTQRFGEITPFLVEDVVPNDSFKVSSSHELKTYTLGQVMMSGVKFDKDYFFVPMEAILPHGFQYFQKPPVHGDDVDPLKVGCKFPYKAFVNARISSIKSNVVESDWYPQITNDPHLKVLYFLYEMQSLYYMIGSGTLLDALCCRVNNLQGESARFYNRFDEAMRDFWNRFWSDSNFAFTYRIYIDSDTYQEISMQVGSEGDLSKFRTFLWFLFESGQVVEISSGSAEWQTAVWEAYKNSDLKIGIEAGSFDIDDSFPDLLDVRKLVAYQLTTTQFYTNDRIDNVYNCDLWHHNYQTIVNSTFPSVSGADGKYFNKWFYGYNGAQVQYDSVSGYAFNIVNANFNASNFNQLFVGSATYYKWRSVQYLWASIQNIFGLDCTLKYNDYFLGSKLQPLAVGDVSIPVVDSSVSAIDTTKNILMQRFLHAVNRIGSSIDQFRESIFGNKGKQYHAEPRYLVHDTFNIVGQEIESTYGSGGATPQENQGYIVTNLKSTANNFAFEMSFSEHGVLLGLSVIRSREVYSRGVHRSWFWQDRYDEFNPMLQSIGDQSVSVTELTGDTSKYDVNYGYQDRNGEYKQAYSTCHGGFSSGALKGWAYIHDNYYDCEQRLGSLALRLRPTSFDYFYTQLSAVYQGDYFHFIVSMVNAVDANRQMDYITKILAV